jgi:hypothetical protein
VTLVVLSLYKAAKAAGNAANMVATRARTTNTEKRRSEIVMNVKLA